MTRMDGAAKAAPYVLLALLSPYVLLTLLSSPAFAQLTEQKTPGVRVVYVDAQTGEMR